MSNPLRNANIDYARGWFFVTAQVARNKSQFGVIAGGRCELNDLGRQVETRWRELFRFRPEFQADAFVVMPNHFHAVLKLRGGGGGGDEAGGDEAPPPREAGTKPRLHENEAPNLVAGGLRPPGNLSRAMQIFKSLAAHDYLALLKAGRCPDIGGQLWMRSFYDNLITTHRELENIRAYIHANPARWDRDRFGPVTAYHRGDLELLNQPLVAYVASEGQGRDTEIPPLREAGTKPRLYENEAPPRREWLDSRGTEASTSVRPLGPVISTFTSAQERAVLAKCLAARRAYIHVMPGGIPEPLPSAWAQACAEGRALLLSPSAPGTGVNKQRAIWCNRYVLDHAATIWHGTIRPGGTLETLLRACRHAWQPGAKQTY